jgi:hypothetical protein
MDMTTPTDSDMDSCPRVLFTSDLASDPSVVDDEYDAEEWSSAPSIPDGHAFVDPVSTTFVTDFL